MTTERVVETALALVDAEGLAALNTRRLADELGVSAMTPYSYVGRREDLLNAMVELALPGPRTATDDALPWQIQLRAAMREVHADFLRHPGVLELLMTRTMAEPGLDRWRERVYGILASAGFTAIQSATMGSTLTSLVFGSIIVERFRVRQNHAVEIARLSSLNADEFPNLRAIAHEYAVGHSGTAPFELGLASVIRELEAKLAS